jgi:hypothetical protein
MSTLRLLLKYMFILDFFVTCETNESYETRNANFFYHKILLKKGKIKT